MTLRPLTSAELGRKGERKFGDLIHPSLSVNPSEEDLRGWDFYIEFPHDAQDANFDIRHPHKRFLIQVKTMWHDTNSAKLKLSSAEYLAKSPLPSGVLAIRINDDEELHDIHFIEMRNTPLERVLKRLRKASRDEEFELHKKYISFNIAKYGEEISVEDSTYPISEFMDGLVEDQNLYILDKIKTLRDLGFNRDIIHVGIPNTGDNNLEELSLVSLGLKSFTPSRLTAMQERFGIELPHPEIRSENPENISITMGPNEGSEIIMRFSCPRPQLIADLEGTLYGGVFGTIDQHPPFIFETTIFKLVVLGLESGKSTLEFKILEDEKYDPKELLNYCVVQLALNSDDGTIGLLDEAGNFADGLDANYASPSFDHAFFNRLLYFSYALAEFNRVANKALKFSIVEIFTQQDALKVLTRHTGTPDKAGDWSFISNDPLPPLEQVRYGCFIKVIKLHETYFAIKTNYPSLTVKGTTLTFNFEMVDFSAVIQLGDETTESELVKERYRAFIDAHSPTGDNIILGVDTLE